MPFRLYRRKQIVPGVRLNLSRSGPSLSLGGRGAHYTVGHGQRRATVGIPGSGLFYTQYSHQHARAPRQPRAAVAAVPQQSNSDGVMDLFHRPPGAKIGYGLLLTVLLITAPIGVPLLLTGIVQLVASRRWRARRLLARANAAGSPAASRALLDAAAALQPEEPEVLAAQGAWNVAQERWPDAVQMYARYLALVPTDPVARGQYARALLMEARVEDAISELQQLQALPLDDESHASVTAVLALAWLMKGDAGQALALVRETPLQRHHLGPGLQQCLRYRAIAFYMTGNTSRAVADLDRLYALNPTFAELASDKTAMKAGVFALATPTGSISRSGVVGASPSPAQPPPHPSGETPAGAPALSS